MISTADLALWQQGSPLELDADQAERELILRRLLIEIGNDELLANGVVCSGGTTLHQALLPHPRRHSEDLDLLAAAPLGPLRPICDRWHDFVAPRLGAAIKIDTRKQITKIRVTVPGEHSTTTIKVELAKSPLHVAAAGGASRRLVSMATGWFSGSAQVLCVAPATLAASKVSAIRGRNKPRDLSDLCDMRTMLALSADAVAERFYDLYRIAQWTPGKAREVVTKFHRSPKFLRTLQHEINGGFIPADFDLAAAQDAYLSVVDAAERIHLARKAAAAADRLRTKTAAESPAHGKCQHPNPSKGNKP